MTTKTTMKKRLTAIIAAISMLAAMLPFGASAAVTVGASNEIDFESNVTFGDLTNPWMTIDQLYQTEGTWENVAYADIPDGERATLETEDDNTVLNIPTTSRIRSSIKSAWEKNYVKRVTADFKLDETQGTSTEILSYVPDYTNYDNRKTPVIIDNGAVLAQDLNFSAEEFYEFAPEGTIQADTWYTIDRWLDIRTRGVNMSRFEIKNKATGETVVSTGWHWNGTALPYNNGSTHFTAVFFRTDATALKIDNLNSYSYTNLPEISFASASNDLAINNYMIVPATKARGLVLGYACTGWSGVPVLGEVLKSNKHHWKLSVMFPTLPTKDINIFGWIASSGASAMYSDIHSGPVVVNSDKMYYNTWDAATDKYVRTEISDVTVEAGKWYTVEVDYFGYIMSNSWKPSEANDGTYIQVTDGTGVAGLYDNVYYTDPKAGAETENVNISVSSDGTEIFNIKNNPVYKRLRAVDTKYGAERGALGFVNFPNVAVSGQVYVDDISITTSYEENGEDVPVNLFVTGFEDYEPDTNFQTVIETERKKHVTTSGRTIFNISYTLADTSTVTEPTIFDVETVGTVPSSVKFIFSQPMNKATLTKDNFEIVSNWNMFEAIEGYEVTAAEDGLSCVISFTTPLEYETTYYVNLLGGLGDADYGIPPMAAAENPMAMTQEHIQTYIFTTGSANPDDLALLTIGLTDNAGAAYEKAVTEEGDVIKATATFKNITGQKTPAAVILAVYDGTKLVDVLINETGVESSVDTVTYETLPYTATAGLTVKAFIWNSLAAMSPMN